ncbi:hypothetical protein BLNAU_20217 [Blattamonas nauphoetae]|uniref:Ubiquitin-like domain-containing protein n=1 Tax=Blattamonas nauphoetae TaxID=2049346 RepID=A0ABQ9X0K0_9EUKA|nr:hypothetical protein BLNAU_20217 [Blattamonas nauphoetae]
MLFLNRSPTLFTSPRRPNRRLDIGLDNHTSTGHSLTGQQFSLAGPGTSIRIDAFKSLIEPLQDITSLANIPKTSPNFPNAPFDLMVKSAFTGDQFTLHVNPQNTILQIKQQLVPQMNVSIEDICLMFEADEPDDSTKMSEIDFDGHYAIIAFIDEPVDPITVKVPSKENTEEQPSTQSPSKEDSTHNDPTAKTSKSPSQEKQSWGTCSLSGKEIVKPGWVEGMEGEIFDFDALTAFVKENGMHPTTFDPIELHQIRRPLPDTVDSSHSQCKCEKIFENLGAYPSSEKRSISIVLTTL